MRSYLIALLLAVCFVFTGCGVSKEDYENLQKEKNSLSSQITSLNGQVSSQNEQIASLNEQISTLTSERDDYKSKYEQVSQKRDKLNARVTELEGKISKLQEEAKKSQQSSASSSSSSYSSGDVITNINDLKRYAKRIEGTTVTVKGKVHSSGSRFFWLEDEKFNSLCVVTDTASWEIADDDIVLVTGVLVEDSTGWEIHHCSSVKRL